jgi:hypothetical protein
MNSVMIQKMDKRALALRLFGKDTEDDKVVDVEEEKVIESEEVE